MRNTIAKNHVAIWYPKLWTFEDCLRSETALLSNLRWKAARPLNALALWFDVSWICDFPGGHSFLQKYGLTTITWLQWGLTSSHMNTVGLIGSTRVFQICRNIQITYLHCMGLEDWTHHHHKDKGRRAMPVFPANVGALFRLLPKTSSQDMFGTKRMTFGRLVSHHVFALAFKKPSTAASDGHRHRLRT